MGFPYQGSGKKTLRPLPEEQILYIRGITYIAKIAEHLTYDNDENILAWIVHHFDSQLSSDIGESQRKCGTPPQKDLVRLGLKALKESCKKAYGKDFIGLENSEQQKILSAIQNNNAPNVPQWAQVSQKDFFLKVTEIIISAYYSHPSVWSQIGYAGPAYPRGYIRVELGITDPWEAKNDE